MVSEINFSKFGSKSNSEIVLPKHIGVILDGNRRYAEKLNKSKLEGHKYGAEAVFNLIKYAYEYGISELTLFSFSLENFKRPDVEVKFLMNLFLKYFRKLSSDLDNNKDLIETVAVSFPGRINLFPSEVRNAMSELVSKSSKNPKLTINFAMAYGGRAEIVDSFKRIAPKLISGEISVEKINDSLLTSNMDIVNDVDLIIRTSEERLSGFLTWQSTYAEIKFLPDLLWPEFDESSFLSCLYDYSKKQRRFGR